MNQDELMKAVTELDDDLIETAGKPYKKKKIWPAAMAAAAAVLALALLLPPALQGGRAKDPLNTDGYPEAGRPESITEPGPNPAAKFCLAEPVYPEQWTREKQRENHGAGEIDPAFARQLQNRGAGEDARPVLAELIRQSLLEEEQESAVMSPINLYLSLAMLAEITDGEAQAELLQALDVTDAAALRGEAQKIWNLIYFDDGREKMIPANSLWLSDALDYRKDTVERLAKSYYASVFRGTMGTAAYDQALRNWINGMTGDLLKEQAEGLSMDAGTRLALVSTVFYQSRWAAVFNKEDNKTAVFHGTDGDRETEFMTRRIMGTEYFYSDRFSFINLQTMNGAVWFFLPDEGVSVCEMMEEEAFINFLCRNPYTSASYDEKGNRIEKDGIGCAERIVNLMLPKMDITRKLDLMPLMEKLGVETCFDPARADFSPILGESSGSISSGEQATRVIMDEEGVSAASYVDWLVGGVPQPEEEVDFTLDRPFFFLISGQDSLPYFAGIMNNP